MQYTYSLCMIVKNEEAVLSRCLDSVQGLFDEIVIVDTGSTDQTREIAARYTKKLYTFSWCDDFSAARNYAFSKCNCDYIYSCDADEVIDEVNRERFLQVMEAMLPEIEIVQMKYIEKDSTVLNTKSELRPKLFKRLRSFVWEDPVHEMVRLEPYIFDSDIEILHLPLEESHAKRDFSIYVRSFQNGYPFSGRLFSLYASELFKCGEADDFIRAIPAFEARMETIGISEFSLHIAYAVLARAYRLSGNVSSFFNIFLEAATAMHGNLCSEICCEAGQYFKESGQTTYAKSWFQRAFTQSSPLIDIHTGGDLAMRLLSSCYKQEGESEIAAKYEKQAHEWKMPEGD